MKKFILAFILCFTLVGCADTKEEINKEENEEIVMTIDEFYDHYNEVDNYKFKVSFEVMNLVFEYREDKFRVTKTIMETDENEIIYLKRENNIMKKYSDDTWVEVLPTTPLDQMLLMNPLHSPKELFVEPFENNTADFEGVYTYNGVQYYFNNDIFFMENPGIMSMIISDLNKVEVFTNFPS